jgi:methylase of polypeptide subunit release factors
MYIHSQMSIFKFYISLDLHYDLIVTNPPWLNASYVYSQTDLDNAIYDPGHKFLKACFNFAKIHLNRDNPQARFVVIFSDLGSILNINDPHIVELLAAEYKLKITNVSRKLSKLKPNDGIDPLKNFKKESKIEIYELQRI